MQSHRILRVLVVDDEASSRKAVAHQLEACGAHPDCVSSAQDALQALLDATIADRPYRAAFLDFHMPDCDGEQLGRLILTYDHLAQTRMVLLGLTELEVDMQRLTDLGFDGHFPKPIPRHLLTDYLRRLMRHRPGAAPYVVALPASEQILHLLRQNPDRIQGLGPEELEELVLNRMEAMGFRCARIGPTRRPDGGIDLIACPNDQAPFPYLMALQIKSHRGNRQTPVGDVRDFMGALAGRTITGGVIITNTSFTPDARWFAQQHEHLLKLRDVHDLRRWIYDEFAVNEFWREIPSQLELRPGLVINVREALSKRRKR
jgi:CheY-like chemotaxis protein